MSIRSEAVRVVRAIDDLRREASRDDRLLLPSRAAAALTLVDAETTATESNLLTYF